MLLKLDAINHAHMHRLRQLPSAVNESERLFMGVSVKYLNRIFGNKGKSSVVIDLLGMSSNKKLGKFP